MTTDNNDNNYDAIFVIPQECTFSVATADTAVPLVGVEPGGAAVGRPRGRLLLRHDRRRRIFLRQRPERHFQILLPQPKITPTLLSRWHRSVLES